MRGGWYIDAERTTDRGDTKWLGEDEDGIFYVSYVDRDPTSASGFRLFWKPFQWWKPRHWVFYLNSWAAEVIVPLETGSEATR